MNRSSSILWSCALVFGALLPSGMALAETPKASAPVKGPDVQFEVDGVKVSFPAIPGYGRLDGIMWQLDQGWQKVAGASGNEVLVVMGTVADVQMVKAGQVPPLKQKIFIQRNIKFPGKAVAKDFHKLRDAFAIEAGAVEEGSLNSTVPAREKALNEALESFENNPGKRRVGTPQMIGFFDEDDSSFCYAMLVPVKIEYPGKETRLGSNAVCLAFMKVADTMVSISVSAPFEDKKSMRWAMDMTKMVRDRILGRP